MRLSASAQDPELDDLSFSWSIASQPAGADVVLSQRRSPTTQAAGLTAPGEYVFSLAVSDGANTVRREAAVKVFRGNQPPRLIDVHNRIPVLVTLPQSQTHLRGGGFDLDGDVITHWWRVKRAPRGAKPLFSKQGGRETRVSDLTAPGVYVFTLTVADRTKFARKDVTVVVNPKGE